MFTSGKHYSFSDKMAEKFFHQQIAGNVAKWIRDPMKRFASQTVADIGLAFTVGNKAHFKVSIKLVAVKSAMKSAVCYAA